MEYNAEICRKAVFSFSAISFVFILFSSQSRVGIFNHSPEKNETLKVQNKKPIRKLKLLFKNTKGPVPFKVEILTEDQGIPWGMVFLNEEELLWTEREGLIKKIHIPTGKVSLITGGPEVYAKGQGGLLDTALHPEFQKNQYIYFSYSLQKKRKQTTALMRGKLKGDKITNAKVLFTARPFVSASRHFGSRLVFDRKGFLFMTVGDRNKKQQAQNLSAHFGKLLRLTDEGKPAPDNPFIKNKQAQPEIWSFGHRNPQGLFIHPETQEIYLQEHGPRGGDEINMIQKGKNYGWPVVTYGKEYIGGSIGEGFTKAGMEDPKKYYIPSIAPCGMAYYNGNLFSKWKNSFFIGSLVLRHLNRVSVDDFSEERLLNTLGKRVRDVRVGPDDFIYFAVEEGAIYRIIPK